MSLAQNGEVYSLVADNERLSENLAKRIIIQIIEGLQYLHNHGLVHRDLKPENFLVTKSNHKIKICDFGSAARIKDGGFDTEEICGSEEYNAPEITMGKPGDKYDGMKADVFSLAISMFLIVMRN